MRQTEETANSLIKSVLEGFSSSIYSMLNNYEKAMLEAGLSASQVTNVVNNLKANFENSMLETSPNFSKHVKEVFKETPELQEESQQEAQLNQDLLSACQTLHQNLSQERLRKAALLQEISSAQAHLDQLKSATAPSAVQSKLQKLSQLLNN